MTKIVGFLGDGRLKRMLLGYEYPIFVVLMCFLSHITSFEWFFCGVILLTGFFAVLATDSMLPLITPACCLSLHISRVNGAADPNSPDFYFSGAGLFASIPFIVIIAVSFGIFFFMRWKTGRLSLKKTPLLLPSLLFSLALLLNGVFSEGYTVKNLAIGAFEVLTVFFFFYVFVLGLSGEDFENLTDKFCFISALISILISLEIGWLFLTNEALIVDGAIFKPQIVFGWGVSNTAGSMLCVLIPVCFLGVMRAKHVWLYFASATLATVAIFFTLSRNSVIGGIITYLGCFALAMIFGKSKKLMRIAMPITAIVIAVFMLIFWDNIAILFRNFIDKGLSDSGRFNIWETAMPSFLSAPIFGVGFFGVSFAPEMTAFIPGMLHCTPLQIIASMGLFGILSYGYYRVMTIIRVVRRPSLAKTMLALAMLVILAGSLLDNFIFYMQQMIYPSIALALVYIADEGKEKL